MNFNIREFLNRFSIFDAVSPAQEQASVGEFISKLPPDDVQNVAIIAALFAIEDTGLLNYLEILRSQVESQGNTWEADQIWCRIQAVESAIAALKDDPKKSIRLAVQATSVRAIEDVIDLHLKNQ